MLICYSSAHVLVCACCILGNAVMAERLSTIVEQESLPRMFAEENYTTYAKPVKNSSKSLDIFIHAKLKKLRKMVRFNTKKLIYFMDAYFPVA